MNDIARLVPCVKCQ